MLNRISSDFLKHWVRLERDHFGLGRQPRRMGADERAHFAVFGDHDARKGESIVQTEKVHSLLKLRALLFRGRLKEAQKELGNLQATQPLERSEVLLEEARLAGFRGRWAEVLDAAEKALALDPQPVTRLALYQCRSIALYELGEFQKSIEDLERIESLAVCLPFSNLVIYGAATRARIYARDRGWTAARTALDAAWAQASRHPNVDTTLALLRTEADIERICGRESFESAQAAFLLADAMGDRLYRDLCLLELALATQGGERQLQDVRSRSGEFERLGSLLAELDGRAVTQSAQSLQRPLKRARRNPPSDVTALVLSRPKQVVDLKTLRVGFHPVGERYFAALDHLAEAPLPKDQFFTRYWKLPRFRPELHDGTIRTLLSRARKELNLQISAAGGVIRAPGAWVVRAHE